MELCLGLLRTQSILWQGRRLVSRTFRPFLNILIFSPITKFSDLGDDNAMKITFTCLFDRSALTDGRRAVVLKADWHKVLVSDSRTVAAAVFFGWTFLNTGVEISSYPLNLGSQNTPRKKLLFSVHSSMFCNKTQMNKTIFLPVHSIY